MATQSGAFLEAIQDARAPMFTCKLLSRNRTQSSLEDPIEEVARAHTIGAEPNLLVGEPYALDAVTHAQCVDAEPDWTWGDLGTPNADPLAHLVGTRPEVLPNEEVLMATENDWTLEEMEEDGSTEETAGFEGEKGPRIELQDPGVSNLPMLKGEKFLTLHAIHSLASQAFGNLLFHTWLSGGVGVWNGVWKENKLKRSQSELVGVWSKTAGSEPSGGTHTSENMDIEERNIPTRTRGIAPRDCTAARARPKFPCGWTTTFWHNPECRI